MLATFSDMLPYISPYVPKADDPLLLQALQKSYRTFCFQSEAFRVVETYDSVADQQTYAVTPANLATGHQGIRVIGVWTRTSQQVTDGDDGQFIPVNKYRVSFPSESVINIFFFNAPFDEVITDGLRVEVALVPNMDSDSVNAHFLNRWSEGVIAGALGILYGMDDKEWFNERALDRHMNIFIDQVSFAKRETEVENSHANIVKDFRSWL